MRARQVAQATPAAEAAAPLELKPATPLLSQTKLDYRYCFTCQTCTNSCPVVRSYEKPVEHLGMLPHQIIHGLALGLEKEAMAAAMTWDCLTCYQCQEACPNLGPITDIFYELRNMAAKAAGRGKAGS